MAAAKENTVKTETTGHESAAGDVRDAEARGYRKSRRGYVVSDKMDKTITVEVEDRVKHPLYGKVLRRTSKVKAHDETNSAGIGDLVLINETRPLTKKPAETRMGSGKGSPEWWVANVKPGRVLFEVAGVDEQLAREALTRAIHKLPLKARIIKREEGDA